MLIRIAKEPTKKYYQLFIDDKPIAAGEYPNLLYHLETILAFEHPEYDASGEVDFIRNLIYQIILACERIHNIWCGYYRVIDLEYDQEGYYRWHLVFNDHAHVKGVAHNGVIDEDSCTLYYS